MSPVRIGVLGAARIAPAAIVKPARNSEDAEVVAVAARDRSRAEAFAAKHGIPRVLRLLRRPARRSRHRRRSTTRCPTACTRSGRSPRSRRASTCCARSRSPQRRRGRTGGRGRRPHRARGDGGVPLPLPPARAAHARAGGERRARHAPARRDRALLPAARSSPTSATSTTSAAAPPWTSAATPSTSPGCSASRSRRSRRRRAKLRTPDVDRAMRAELAFPSGHTGRITCSMWSTRRAQDLRARRAAPRRAPRDQPDQSADVAPHAGEGRRRDAHRAVLAPPDVRVPARRVHRRGAARRADAHSPVRLDREHARDRRDLRRRGHAAARAPDRHDVDAFAVASSRSSSAPSRSGPAPTRAPSSTGARPAPRPRLPQPTSTTAPPTDDGIGLRRAPTRPTRSRVSTPRSSSASPTRGCSGGFLRIVADDGTVLHEHGIGARVRVDPARPGVVDEVAHRGHVHDLRRRPRDRARRRHRPVAAGVRRLGSRRSPRGCCWTTRRACTTTRARTAASAWPRACRRSRRRRASSPAGTAVLVRQLAVPRGRAVSSRCSAAPTSRRSCSSASPDRSA